MALTGWQWVYVGVVMGLSLLVAGYVECRRLLFAALDDRYGEWKRFWQDSRQPGPVKSRSEKIQFILAFFFCHGLRDLWHWITLVTFDLFVVFAIQAPFWRHVFFEDFNPVAACLLGGAGAALFLGWKLKRSLPLCQVHAWSSQTGRCERCGEPYLEPERITGVSWHGWWQRRLERLATPPDPS